jgi:hypothetical protein
MITSCSAMFHQPRLLKWICSYVHIPGNIASCWFLEQDSGESSNLCKENCMLTNSHRQRERYLAHYTNSTINSKRRHYHSSASATISIYGGQTTISSSVHIHAIGTYGWLLQLHSATWKAQRQQYNFKSVGTYPLSEQTSDDLLLATDG